MGTELKILFKNGNFLPSTIEQLEDDLAYILGNILQLEGSIESEVTGNSINFPLEEVKLVHISPKLIKSLN